jgi:hypothetical protein
LIASITQLEVRCRGCQFIDELVDHIAQPGIFVTLKISLKVIFSKTLVNLQEDGQPIINDDKQYLASAKGSSSSESSPRCSEMSRHIHWE